MSEERQSDDTTEEAAPDSGLKRLLTYTFIALVLAVLAALLAVSLVIRWFDTDDRAIERSSDRAMLSSDRVIE